MQRSLTILCAALTLTLTPMFGNHAAAQDADLPVVTVDRDNFRVERSCLLRFRGPIPDVDGNGVVHITGDGLTVAFAPGESLQGAAKIADTDTATPWDQLVGTGIRIENGSNITVRNARVHGYKVGIHATRTPGLTVEDADLSDNYRARLGSTREAEDGSDWLSPHRNDDNQWATNYGAALYIEDCDNVTVRRVFVRRGQNGIVLDRVNDSRIYDNDASFLSAWGIALWRSNRNVISRNAVDFCVRGHSEGIYNRGQDSAGILFFEQCSDNLVIENSATHGGDGFFGFAGLEALGLPDTRDESLDYRKIGCNNNVFLYNDFSYAPAHGLEMTFSFGNIIMHNRFVENAITGVWGGFSQDTLIARNLFAGNGGMAYGLERGGVNIEHSINNTIVDNDFINNRVGVALWWDNPGDVHSWDWGVNYGPLEGNTIAYNRFVINDEPRPFFGVGPDEKRLGIWLRDDQRRGNLSGTVITGNDMQTAGPRAQPERIDAGIEVNRSSVKTLDYDIEPAMQRALGDTRPVRIRDGIAYSVRDQLQGRENIIVDQWGPWDHRGTFVRVVRQSADEHVYEIFGVDGAIDLDLDGEGVTASIEPADTLPGVRELRIQGSPGVRPFAATVTIPGADDSREPLHIEGTLIQARWRVVFFNWPPDADPREDEQAWLRHARGRDTARAVLPGLNFPYGMGGPADQDLPEAVKQAGIAPDRFGMIARTAMPLTAGRWRITTVSDDGIRVLVDDQPVIDNWTWHPPQTDTGEFTLDRDQRVEIEVRHFEIDGGAMLKFDIEKLD